MRVGLLGLDMSHAVEFTRRLNDSSHPECIAGARVTCAWPGGSDDFELSRSRVGRFTQQVREEFGVEILPSPQAVAQTADVIFITAADGRVHRRLFEQVIEFRRPTFIEKPIATSHSDAAAIFDLALAAKVPVMSCSTARFGAPLANALAEHLGPVIGCDVFGPMPEEPTQPGLFWYGVHSVEVLNVVMGRGCREVRSVRTDETDLMTATWRDGRIATFRGTRSGEWKFGVTIHRAKAVQFVDLLHNSWFKETLERILRDLPNGKSPVDPADTLEIVRVIEAANKSRPDGRAVPVEEGG